MNDERTHDTETYLSPCNEMVATRTRPTNIVVTHKVDLRNNVFYQKLTDHLVYCYLVHADGTRHTEYRAAFPDLTTWTRVDEAPSAYCSR